MHGGSILTIALSLSIAAAVSDFKLSDSKLLLPYYSFIPVNYTLKGSDGTCYTWLSGTPEVATVTPVSGDVNGCSKEAVVTVVWQSSHRAVTTIYAQVSTTGQVVKCDVIVDDIHRIGIETTTQELYIHNTPEALTIVAFDEHGNTFSTLEGVPFDWHIVHGDTHGTAPSPNFNVLRFLSWTESEYVTPKSLAALELKGLQGYMQLVSGLRTGSAVVRVSLTEHVYRHVPLAQVRLLVLANAQLSPALAFLIPASRLKLQVRVIQLTNDKIVDMPSSQYHLRVNDSATLELDQEDGSTVTALNYGQTEVTLFDRNVEEALLTLPAGTHSETGVEDIPRLPRRRLPTSLIYVVEPAYLGFSLHQHSTLKFCQQMTLGGNLHSSLLGGPSHHLTWVMELDQAYVIQLDIYDHNSHRIHPTENLRLEFSAPKEKLKILESSANGTYYVVQAIGSPGQLSVEAKLIGLLNKNGVMSNTMSSVTGSQEIIVYEPITIQPSLVVLPWPTSTDISHQLTAVGGTAQYSWRTGRSTEGAEAPVSVRLSSDGHISALSYGTTTVVVSSPSHPQLCATATVVVSEPSTIRFVPGPSEVVAPRTGRSASPHNKLLVGLAVLDTQGRSMTNCLGLDIDFQEADGSVLKVLPERLEPSYDSSASLSECVRVPVVGLEPGFTEIVASYRTPPTNVSELGSTHLSTVRIDLVEHSIQTSRFPIAVYKDVLFVDPVSSRTYVALGSTRTFVFVEGPRPWPLDTGTFFSRISSTQHGDADSLPSIVHDPRPFHGQLTLNTSIAERDESRERYSRPMTFTLRCESLGSFTFRVESGNRPSKSNVAPILMHSEFKIACVVPYTVQLDLHRPIPGDLDGHPPCPLVNSTISDISTELWIPNTVPSLISLTYFDSDGHVLEGFDSLVTTVSLQDPSKRATDLVAQPTPTVQYSVGLFFALTKQFPTAPTNPVAHFFVSPAKVGTSTGSFVVHVNSVLQRAYANRLGSNNTPKLEAHLSVRFIPSVTVLPTEALQIFHLLKSDSAIKLVGGSGHYSLEHSASDHKKDESLLDISSDSPTEQASQHRTFHLRAKRMGQGHLRVIDLCYPQVSEQLDGTTSAHLPIVLHRPVEVIGLESLILHVVDRIELGKQTTAYLEVLDSHGSPLPPEFLRSLELRVGVAVATGDAISSSVLDTPRIIQLDALADSEQFAGIPFTIRGRSLGTASLSVWTAVPGPNAQRLFEVRSNLVEIQVFAPLRLSPCNFNLLLGAQYELRASGGPSPAALEFLKNSIGRTEVLIEQQGPNAVLISASGTPGSVDIRARSISHSNFPHNGSRLTKESAVVSEARCMVHIVAMSGIRIATPLVSSVELRSESTPPSATEFDHFMIACFDPNANCPGAPLWIEGFPFHSMSERTPSSSDMLSPMQMAGAIPHLLVNWRLNPPQPPSVARLGHYLSSFNVDVSPMHTAAGMVLFGLAPGRVTIHVTVECLDSKKSVLVDSSGKRVSKLYAQLNVVILPPLGMQFPPIRIAQQLLVSPNSEYRLQPWKEIVQNSQVSYDFVNTTVSDNTNGLLSINSDGILRVGPSTSEAQAIVRVQSWPKGFASSSSRIVQTIYINVIVKPPRYVMVTATEGTYVRSASGLLVGGPYRLDLNFCDELGRVFSAISARHLQLRVQTHRTDLLQTQLLSAGSPGCQSGTDHLNACSTLKFHVTTPTMDVPGQLGTTLTVGLDSSGPQSIKASGFGPTFLTVPHGGELDAIDGSQLNVAQWMCLPDLVEGATWSSSDSSILWVDPTNRLLLPRRQGKAHLVYTLPSTVTPPPTYSGFTPNVTNTEPLSYMIRVFSSSPPSAARFVPVSAQGDRSTGPIVLPVVSANAVSETSLSSVVLKFVVQFDYAVETGVVGEKNTCPPLNVPARKQLAAAAPFYCSLSMPSSDAHLVPQWLSSLLLWNHTLPDLDTSPVPLNQLITSQLEPIAKQHQNQDCTRWQCVVRTNPDLWYQYTPLLALILPPRETIPLQLKASDPDDSLPELSSVNIVPVPGIQMLVPPALMETPGRYHFWINDQTKLSKRLLVFVPPSTAAVMMSRDHPVIVDRLEARSSLPNVLEISSRPRPVSSLGEVSHILKDYVTMVGSAQSWWAGGSTQVSSALKLWTALASGHSQQLDNEMSSSSTDSVINRHLLWIVDVNAIVGDTALDTVVDVIVSLRQTGQHVVVPVRVHLPSRAQLIESGAYSPGGFLSFLQADISWIHLFILILSTLVIGILVLWLNRSSMLVSSSTGTSVLKNLPGTATPPSYSRHPGSPQLWTQSSYSPSPNYSGHSAPFAYTPTNLVSPGIPAAGDAVRGEQKWRSSPRGGGSPSRLRGTFDNI